MSEDRFKVRCLGCGKKTRRSRCSKCRPIRKREVNPPTGRYARKEARKR